MNQIKIENIGTVQSVLKAVKCIECKKCFIIVQIKSTFLTIQTRHFSLRCTYVLDTIQDFFVQVGHETTYAAIENHHFFTIPCRRQTYQNY